MKHELDSIVASASDLSFRLAALRQTANADDAAIIATAEASLNDGARALWPLRNRGEPSPRIEQPTPAPDPERIAAEQARQAAEEARREAQDAKTRERMEDHLARAFDGVSYAITVNASDVGSLLLRSRFDDWRIEGDKWELLAQVAGLKPAAVVIELDGVDPNFRNSKTRLPISPAFFLGAIKQAMEAAHVD